MLLHGALEDASADSVPRKSGQHVSGPLAGRAVGINAGVLHDDPQQVDGVEREAAFGESCIGAGAAPVIRFEGLPGEYVQWDWAKRACASA